MNHHYRHEGWRVIMAIVHATRFSTLRLTSAYSFSIVHCLMSSNHMLLVPPFAFLPLIFPSNITDALNTCPAAQVSVVLFPRRIVVLFLWFFSKHLYVKVCLSNWFSASSNNTNVQKHVFSSLSFYSLSNFHSWSWADLLLVISYLLRASSPIFPSHWPCRITGIFMTCQQSTPVSIFCLHTSRQFFLTCIYIWGQCGVLWHRWGLNFCSFLYAGCMWLPLQL